MMMDYLSEDLVRHLLQYLSEKEITALLDCSSFFSRLKKAVRKVKLNEDKQIECCANEDFLMNLLSLIGDPSRQLKNDIK